MHGTLWILIDGRQSEVNAVLAGEALKRAARNCGQKTELDVIGREGSHTPFAGSPAPGDRLLVLGGAEPPMLWTGLPRVVATIQAALENADGVIRAAGHEGGNGQNLIKKAFAYISGRFKASN